MHKEIINKLIKNGYEAFLCGGCVRDMLLGRIPTDFDITTNATPEDIQEIFSDSSYKVDTVGKAFLITLVGGYEVATYRSDYSDHAKPAKTFKEDALRRDFTINAMAYDINTNKVVDYFGGIKDLEDGVIRFVGDPSERIQEDPVRMLRACRFAAKSDSFKLCIDSYKAIIKNKCLIDSVPKERINKEIIKVLSTCDKPSLFFINLDICGILKRLLPEIKDCMWFTGGKHHTEFIHEHLFDCCNNLPKEKPLLRLAGLLHDIGKPVTYNPETYSFLRHEKVGAEMSMTIMNRLKFSNKEISYVSNLILLHMRNLDLNSKPKSIRKLLANCKKLNIPWRDLLLLRFADQAANRRKEPWGHSYKNDLYNLMWKEWNDPDNCFDLSQLNVNGFDMIALGYKGNEIKKALDMLLKSVISNNTLNRYDMLMSMAKGNRKLIRKGNKQCPV